MLAELRQQGAEAELEGEAADRGLALAVGELVRLPSPSRAIAPLACSPPAAARSSPPASSPAPWLRPFGASLEQAAAGGALGEAAAQCGDGAGGAAQAGPESGEAAGAGRARCAVKRLPELAQRPAARGDRRRADHRPHPGLGGDPALPAAEQGEPLAGS